MYDHFRNESLQLPVGGHVAGFSQRQTLNSSLKHLAQNIWLADGTPIFSQPVTMWYPQHGVCPANLTLTEQCACMEEQLKMIAVSNLQRPLFVPVYGAAMYVDVALCMSQRLPATEWEVVGVQDFASLGRAAAPSSQQRNQQAG